MNSLFLLRNFPLFPDEGSTVARNVDGLFFFITAVSAFFSVLIVAVIIYFFIRYRRRSETEAPQPIEGSNKLEITWTVIPFGLVMIMFLGGAYVYFTMARPPRDTMDIYVVGKQWMWKIQHPEGNREINELHVPVNTSIRLTMTTEDVIHSFYIPDFRIKQDVVPGRYTTMWFKATKPGKYQLFCAEYCGTNHSGMIGTIYVMEPADYEAWLSGGAAEGSLASQGQKVFQDLACNTCHRSDAQGRGPVLDGLFGKPVQIQGGQTLVADESYLRESILNPRAKLVMGFEPIMPTFQGQVSEEQLLQLIAYIKSLGAPGEQQQQGSINTPQQSNQRPTSVPTSAAGANRGGAPNSNQANTGAANQTRTPARQGNREQ
ncbi:MAG: cytochrome c oxidase subunit II [Pyrinomonadaceae bacterium]|nr:cytochrome c oxidase subunit II [Pyrinomonadaceae bacterium]